LFLFAGHYDLLAATKAAPWGVARLGAVVGLRDPGGIYRQDGRRDLGVGSRGEGGDRGAGGVIIQGG
jgi:hypothetical protein